MSAAAWRALYARLVGASGETVSLVRGFGGGTPTTVTGLRARAKGFQPDDVAGGIQQGERHVILLAADVEGTALVAPQKNDRIVWNGKTLAVTEVNDATRRVGGVAIAYDVIVKGA